jgi:hypothetical protein
LVVRAELEGVLRVPLPLVVGGGNEFRIRHPWSLVTEPIMPPGTDGTRSSLGNDRSTQCLGAGAAANAALYEPHCGPQSWPNYPSQSRSGSSPINLSIRQTVTPRAHRQLRSQVHQRASPAIYRRHSFSVPTGR